MVTPTLRKKLWRDLWSLRTQILTTAILIICGVSLLVATWSAYRSLQKARETYYAEYAFADVFADFKNASSATISRLHGLAGVEKVFARVSIEGVISVNERAEPAVGRFISVPPGEQPPLNRLHLRRGRLPVIGSEVETVIHEGFAQAHGLLPGDSVTVIIQGHSQILRIVGIGLSPEYVYALSPGIPLPDDLHFGVFWLTQKDLQRLARLGDGFNSVVFKVAPNTSLPEIIAEIDTVVDSKGSLGAYARDRQISDMFVQDEIAEQRVSAIFIPVIFLGIATFLINIIAGRLVALQRAQIATLKAVGYTQLQISVHYLQLIFVMTLIGTIPGLALGSWLGRWMSITYSHYFHFPELNFYISLPAATLGAVAGILPGLLGAATSIHWVFRLTPAEAMRPQPPPAFHATLFDRFQLKKKLRARERMVFRNLLQRPGRLTMSLLSLASALGIVITASSWADMFDFLLITQFQRIQREDLSIRLLKPRPTSVLQEIASMPGVLALEGYRVVPIRLRYLNHKRELTLTGWPKKFALRQLLDRDLRPIQVPEQGLLLSKFFQTNWGMKVGDFVQIQPLEGSQKLYALSVSGFSEDLIGLQAVMRIEELWTILNEQPGYNQIVTQVDPLYLRDLYIDLRVQPQIVALNLKQSLYQGFRDSFGQVIQNSTKILVVAALLIAFGIIYNSVRVSFSERAWELASLRVLGFSRVNISFILLVEVGIQVLVSLFPGCLLGWGLTYLTLQMIHTESFSFPLVIEFATYGKGIFAVLLAFAFSSWVVWKMVGRLNPVEALKSRE